MVSFGKLLEIFATVGAVGMVNVSVCLYSVCVCLPLHILSVAFDQNHLQA